MSKKRYISLRRELVIGTIGSMLLVALFLTISYMAVMNHVIRKTTLNSVSQQVKLLDEQIAAIFMPYEDRVRDVAIAVTSTSNTKVLDKIIHDTENTLGGEKYCDIYYGSAISRYEEGGVWIDGLDWEPDPDWMPNTRSWWKAAVEAKGDIIYDDPYIDDMSGSLCVTIACAVYDSNKTLLGVSAVDIYLHSLTDTVKNIVISKNSHINILDKDGLYLTNDNPDFRMNKNYFDTAQFTSYTKSSYLDGKRKAFIENDNFYCVSPIANTNWFIVAEGPTSDFSKEYVKLIRFVLLGFIILILLKIGADIIFSTRISASFRYIASGCDLIAKGDFSRKYPDYYTKEASLLSNGFNTFSERLQGIIKSMKQSKSSLNEAGAKLGGTTNEAMSAITQINTNIEQLGETLQSQNSSVERTSESINKIIQSIHSLEKLITNQTQSVQGASSAVEQMIGNISEVNNSVDKMASSFGALEEDAENGARTQEELQSQISEIETQSKLLNEANTVIANIASQTNLLAMNAAIEAAHAGETGKGFAVVADEIRKLSETSTQQSKAIGDQLKRIQETIGAVVEATQRGVKGYAHLAEEIQETDTIVQQIKSAMSEQQTGSAQITNALYEMNNSSSLVQQASQEMITDSRIIIDEVTTLHQETDLIKQSMNEMKSKADKINATGDDLSEISVIMEKSIKEIGSQVDQFEG